ncbi:putative C6 transcription factor [Aspergillus affinis]|uniref:putative C6 transcription factor n=1 Tax=Aspergillus affinis TaxID=1070780 RepID=UPI0022FED684|nr:uncharacterized protein KD926_006221 [Aspergillus affinis]KAI9042097.1 hypothetical protein KD926_006221 [Aspergillus affinis]
MSGREPLNRSLLPSQLVSQDPASHSNRYIEHGTISAVDAEEHPDALRPRKRRRNSIDRLFEQMQSMQEQITALSSAVHLLAEGHPGITPPRSTETNQQSVVTSQRPFSRLSTAGRDCFQGPTTSAFSFDLAKSSLQSRGIVERHEADGEADADGYVTQEPSPRPSPTAPDKSVNLRGGDALWMIGKTEALRLCRVYEEEMGIMYPVLDLSELLHQVEVLYSSRSGEQSTEALDSDDVHILRLVFACALTAEASGSSELAMRLFDSVREVADNCVWGAPAIKSIIFLTLVAIFYFQMDEETLAWRTIGIVERMSLEKGLHRRETLTQLGLAAEGRERVLRLFWSIYILDIRWSFGTGMPFSLEDTDIDPWLPEPEEKTPYLRVMIRYSRIAAKVWKFISAFNNTDEIRKDEMNYLNWQVLQWIGAIPDSLRLDHHPVADSGQDEPRSIRRLRSLLYLRSNQLRMLIHRPVLHSAAHIMRYPSESQTVVDIAKDTIRFIARLNETSDIYRLQQVAFNWFLVSALAVLFLAVAQTPSQFSGSCKEEFYMALELVKGFSTRSYISRKLWRSIRSLRKLGPQLGLHVHGNQPQHQHQHSAQEESHTGDGVYHPEENGETEIESFDAPVSTSNHSHSPLDGAQMTRELMEWFEAVGNLEDQIMGVGPQSLSDLGWQHGGRMAGGNGYLVDYGGELSSLMKDCF